MAQTFRRLIHPGDAPHLAVALKRYVSNIETSYSALDSPVFTGDPQAPTPPTPDNDTSIATTAFVKNQNYAPLASPIFTGDPKAPTPPAADNDTSIATTAYVQAQGYATTTTVTAGDALRVLKAGDTMTGVLAIANGHGIQIDDATTPSNNFYLNSSGDLFRLYSSKINGEPLQIDVSGGSPGIVRVNTPLVAPQLSLTGVPGAGQLGEVVQAINSTGIALPSGTSVTIASIVLTAGDWDVQGEVFFLACTGNPLQAGINTVAATMPGTIGLGVALTLSPPTGNGYTVVPLSPVRASLAGTTTYYLIANQTGSTGSPTGQGKIWARRCR